MNDDPVSTQRPARRHTDPGRALAALEGAVPGLPRHRRPEPGRPDLAVIEEGLGTGLPPDYVHLARWYPTFVLGDFLLVDLPEPGAEAEWLGGVHRTLDVLREAWLEPDTRLRAHPARGGLLPWGESNESDKFLWSTTGDGPADWRVTVATRGGAWWHYDGGVVQFLAEYCAGTLEPWDLPPLDPEVTPC